MTLSEMQTRRNSSSRTSAAMRFSGGVSRRLYYAPTQDYQNKTCAVLAFMNLCICSARSWEWTASILLTYMEAEPRRSEK